MSKTIFDIGPDAIRLIAHRLDYISREALKYSCREMHRILSDVHTTMIYHKALDREKRVELAWKRYDYKSRAMSCRISCYSPPIKMDLIGIDRFILRYNDCPSSSWNDVVIVMPTTMFKELAPKAMNADKHAFTIVNHCQRLIADARVPPRKQSALRADRRQQHAETQRRSPRNMKKSRR